MTERVVVTGMGAVTPLGNSVDEFLTGYSRDKLGLSPSRSLTRRPLGLQLPVRLRIFSQTNELKRN